MSKKIMFSDKFGLTKAVLEGRKTQTRRIIVEDVGIREDGCAWFKDELGEYHIVPPTYLIGEEVAVAQRYSVCRRAVCLMDSPGWNNKMFVSADLMPHRIRITNVRVERLQDISDEDCLKEGIIQRYNDCLRKNIFGFHDGNKKVKLTVSWKVDVGFDTPREAFDALIDKTCGRGTWDSNPWVFVYDFELIK